MVQTLETKSKPGAQRRPRPSDVLVGGTNSAFPLPDQPCITHASGTRVLDDKGREFTDFLLASGPLIIGHAHPAVTAALSAQLNRGVAYYSVNPAVIEMAERLVAIDGCVEVVRFASTGTEATMHALRLARGYTGRETVMVFEGGYHGSHDVSIVGHRGALRAQAGGIPAGVVRDTLVARFNDLDSVRRLFADHGLSIAAVLIEPQQRSVDPAPGFLEEVRSLCSRYGAVMVFDEVLTGFRLAFGGAQEYYSVEPDLVCYGKILGGGLALSAVGGRREIMELSDPHRGGATDFVHFSGTLSGNPLSCVAGLSTLYELDRPGVYERLHELGDRLRKGLREAVRANSVRAEVVGSGPIAAVAFADPDGEGSGQRLKARTNAGLLARGILAQLQTRLYVSLVHTEEEIDCAVDTFSDSLMEALDQ